MLTPSRKGPLSRAKKTLHTHEAAKLQNLQSRMNEHRHELDELEELM